MYTDLSELENSFNLIRYDLMAKIVMMAIAYLLRQLTTVSLFESQNNISTLCTFVNMSRLVYEIG